ncbi:hypothetical protein E5676_scaffold323G00370 [Cucumis melo var. makuwa]|uniref:Uncharacterized protein n=1 Tax=Cucumis melo var. makuwa TaxID=1194695 RepID=A0A5D3CDT6_CUCMM|nr:hypothetical protein E5676_scaffold323G00370 [Cucumis melo var. makuwa]
MEAPKVVMSSPYTIKALCLKVVYELLTFLQALVLSDVCSQATLNQTITLHQNKEERRLKTQNKVKEEEKNSGEEKASSPPPLLKRKKVHLGASSLQKMEKGWKLGATINRKPLAILLSNTPITSSKIQILQSSSSLYKNPTPLSIIPISSTFHFPIIQLS